VISVSKLEAASRQLDTAIRLLFSHGDAVAIHSLAAAAANVFFDVAEARNGGISWRARMREDSRLTEKELKRALHDSWNFFKHADHDPNGVLQFNERESEDLMFMAVLECGDLQPTTHAMQVFQLWYMAAYKGHLADREPVFKDALSAFPGLAALDRAAQLALGAALLNNPPAE
jgi:hypothetical protein